MRHGVCGLEARQDARTDTDTDTCPVARDDLAKPVNIAMTRFLTLGIFSYRVLSSWPCRST